MALNSPMHQYYLSLPSDDEWPLPVDGLTADGRAIFFLVQESNPALLVKLNQSGCLAEWLNYQGQQQALRHDELMQKWLAQQPSGVPVSRHELLYAQVSTREEAFREFSIQLMDL